VQLNPLLQSRFVFDVNSFSLQINRLLAAKNRDEIGGVLSECFLCSSVFVYWVVFLWLCYVMFFLFIYHNPVGKIAKKTVYFVNSSLKIQCQKYTPTDYFFGDFAHWKDEEIMKYHFNAYLKYRTCCIPLRYRRTVIACSVCWRLLSHAGNRGPKSWHN